MVRVSVAFVECQGQVAAMVRIRSRFVGWSGTGSAMVRSGAGSWNGQVRGRFVEWSDQGQVHGRVMDRFKQCTSDKAGQGSNEGRG